MKRLQVRVYTVRVTYVSEKLLRLKSDDVFTRGRNEDERKCRRLWP